MIVFFAYDFLHCQILLIRRSNSTHDREKTRCYNGLNNRQVERTIYERGETEVEPIGLA
jgi:hypothetical protein